MNALFVEYVIKKCHYVTIAFSNYALLKNTYYLITYKVFLNTYTIIVCWLTTTIVVSLDCLFHTSVSTQPKIEGCSLLYVFLNIDIWITEKLGMQNKKVLVNENKLLGISNI